LFFFSFYLFLIKLENTIHTNKFWGERLLSTPYIHARRYAMDQHVNYPV
jgi:hypothetical protein